MAIDLFAWADGSVLRDRGMALAADAQEHDAPGWSRLAYDVIVDIAASQRTVHVDDVLARLDAAPVHPNAWGSVWRKAIAAGIISRSGQMRETRDPRKHRHQYPIYFSELWSAR